MENAPEDMAEETLTKTKSFGETSLRKKLRVSMLVNVALALALLFVGGAYAALLSQPAEKNDLAVEPAAPQNTDAQAGEAGQQGSDPQPKVVDAKMLAAKPYMVLGQPDAPITMYEWTDFTCPYCGVFNRETLPVIISEYVDTGKVRIELHDVTYIGPQAEDAAVAARAAGEQGKYFEYLFAIYDLGRDNNNPDLSRDTLFAIAENLELDAMKFEAAFDGDTLRKEVQLSTLLAQDLGVSAVPFFVTASTGTLEGLQDIRGAQPIEQFRAILDAQIERVEG